LRLELKDIKDGNLSQQLSYKVADFPVLLEMQQRGEVSFVAPIDFQLRFQKSGQLVEVDGQLATTVKLGCGRCLQDYRVELTGEFAFTYTPYVAEELDPADQEVEVELETDELGLVYYKDETLELQQPLQDQLVMALPISPLCADTCKGLCSECGCNLNVDSCRCEKKIFNNKFSALAGLKIDKSKE
jgi:uncharacterized protein